MSIREKSLIDKTGLPKKVWQCRSPEAAAAGLDTTAAGSLGERVLEVDVEEVAVLGGGAKERPECFMLTDSATGESGRMPRWGY